MLDFDEDYMDVPMEIIELIQKKPEIAYKLMKTTLLFTLINTTKQKDISLDVIDNVIFKYLDEHSVQQVLNSTEIN